MGNSSELNFTGHTVWQVKASTLCNLRCRYCYEWERLEDSRRIAPESWRHIFLAARDYQRIRFNEFGLNTRVHFAWHGGEATVLPKPYVEEVLNLQQEVLGAQVFESGEYANAVQTNLYQLNSTLDLMIDHQFLLSVSLDYMSGARVDVKGRDAEPRVMDNLKIIQERGVRFGIAMVLGRHNHKHLLNIYDQLQALGAEWLNLIPMLDPPEDAPAGNLQLTAEESVQALQSLLVHRQQNNSTLLVTPIDRALETVSRYSNCEKTHHSRNRSITGESRLIVHPDGTLASQAGSSRPERVFGNVFTQPIRELFDSPAYQASLLDDDEKRLRHCVRCEFENACSQRPAFELRKNFPIGPCPVESKLCTFALQQLQTGPPPVVYCSSV